MKQSVFNWCLPTKKANGATMLTDAVRHDLAARYRSGEPVASIAQAYGVKATTVYAWMRKSDVALQSPLYKKPDAAKLELIASRYAEGASVTVLAEEWSVHPATICRWLESHGASRRGPSSSKRIRHPLREDVFDEINEESAYWIGFLMADGHIDDTGPGSSRINLTLKASDEGHLLKFLNFLGAEQRIKRFVAKSPCSDRMYEQVKVAVRSERLVRALSRFGVGPRKSLTARVTGLEMNRDFWRGAVDGDGSVWISHNGWCQLHLCGSRYLMEQFREYMATVCPGKRKVVPHGGNCFGIKVGRKVAWDSIVSLYKGCSVALDRKWKIARIIMAADCLGDDTRYKWQHVSRREIEALYEQHRHWGVVAKRLGIRQDYLGVLRNRLGITVGLQSRRPRTASN